MARIAAQILIGFMLLYGAITLAPKLLFHVRNKNISRALYFLLLCLMSLVLTLASFYYAYLGIIAL